MPFCHLQDIATKQADISCCAIANPTTVCRAGSKGRRAMSEEPESAENLEDPDILEEARSPLSGMGSAMSAGASLLATAQSMTARKARRGVKIEHGTRVLHCNCECKRIRQ